MQVNIVVELNFFRGKKKSNSTTIFTCADEYCLEVELFQEKKKILIQLHDNIHLRRWIFFVMTKFFLSWLYLQSASSNVVWRWILSWSWIFFEIVNISSADFHADICSEEMWCTCLHIGISIRKFVCNCMSTYVCKYLLMCIFIYVYVYVYDVYV